MGNWTITIKGIGTKAPVRELAQNAVEHIIEELGQNVTSAEFISDTPEDSLNLLARRDEDAKEKFKTPDPFPVPNVEPEAPVIPAAPEAPVIPAAPEAPVIPAAPEAP